MKKQLMYIVELKVNPGKEEALNELIGRLIEATGKEKGVLHYHWGLNGDRCLTIEHFENNDAAIDHLNTFAANFAEEYLALGEVTACTVFGEPNEEVKKILDGFGAVYMKTLARLDK